MIALLCMLFIIAVLGVLMAWLGAHPGSVRIEWFDYEIITSAPFLLLLIIIAAALLTLAYSMLRGLMRAPQQMGKNRDIKQLRLALNEITYSVAALAASDMKDAHKHTKKAEKFLGPTPLTLMLRAQISKNEGNDQETRLLLEQLLDHPETEYLAAKSLADGELKQQHLPQAITMAKRAHTANPKQSDGAWAVLELLLKDGQLQEAEAHVQQARKKKSFSKHDVKRAQGKIAFHQAKLAFDKGNKEAALNYAKIALKALPHNEEVVVLAAELYESIQHYGKALALIESQWKIAPSAALANLFRSVIDDEKPAKQDKLRAKLKAMHPQSPEAELL